MFPYFKGGFQEASKHRHKSEAKPLLSCKNCRFEKQMSIYNFVNRGFVCPYCSGGVLFPERFTTALLDELGFEYETQKMFEGKNWRFDFYIPNLNLIIEVHGGQHFNNAWSSIQDVVANDREKRLFIKNELCLNYSAVDVSISEPYYAWSMLEQSALSDYMENMDYEKVIQRCNDSIVDKNYNDVIEDYKEGVSLCELVKKYDVPCSILKYRLRKTSIYKNTHSSDSSKQKQVICVTTGEEFGSIQEVVRQTGIGSSHISRCCNRKAKSAGKTPDGRKRVWKYLEDYKREQKELNQTEPQLEPTLLSGAKIEKKEQKGIA